jgi:hypothetical protein
MDIHTYTHNLEICDRICSYFFYCDSIAHAVIRTVCLTLSFVRGIPVSDVQDVSEVNCFHQHAVIIPREFYYFIFYVSGTIGIEPETLEY